MTRGGNLVIIAPNEERPSRFDIIIDSRLILPARFEYVHAAMEHVHRRDFGDEDLETQYVGLRVPADMSAWRACQWSSLRQTKCRTSFQSHD